jgi:hypothetical protein
VFHQLIPVISGHHTSKHERAQELKRLLREKPMRDYPGAKVIACKVFRIQNSSIDLPTQAMASSSVLLRVSDDLYREFIAKLTTEWLPDKRFELLYRGSRDRMTAAAFHDKCDGKGPTLVLVAGQSEGQPVCVFGGYAGKSWERGPESGYAKVIDARDSFLFTVLNPFGNGIVKMAVNEESAEADCAIRCHAGSGPVFGYGGFSVTSSKESPTAVFDEESCCRLRPDGTFGDPLGLGRSTFTGAFYFQPLELEVWSVC